MDTLTRYRQIIKDEVAAYLTNRPPQADVLIEPIMDTVGDHYQIMTTGWMDQVRVYGAILHVDIRDGKIWIQHDGTEEGFANRLVAAGIPKSDIVLAFQSPFKRQFTDFAVR